MIIQLNSDIKGGNRLNLNQKRIVLLVPRMSGGGAERVSSLLCDYLYRHGYDASILETESHRNDYLQGCSYPVHSLGVDGIGPIETFQRLIRLRRFFRDNEPDVIISLGCAFKYFLVLDRSISGKLVLSERNYPPAVYPSREFDMITRLFKRASLVVFQTPEARDCFPDDVRRKSAIIPNPVIDVPNRSAETAPRIVSVCRLEQQKRIDILIRAFGLFHRTHPGYTLTVYGNGSLRSQLQKELEAAGLAECVALEHFTKDVHSKIADAKMFVSTSDYEGMQNSLMEAMAMGIPCVATDCLGGGASYLLDGGRRGILVQRGDAAAVARGMSQLADDAGKACEYSRLGLEIREQLSLDSVCRQWLEFIEGN